MVSNLSGRKPRSARCSSIMLRTMRPAPTSSTTESAESDSGRTPSSAPSPHQVMRIASAPPARASTALSSSSCQTSRPRPAPSARRMASSRSLTRPGARRRSATLVHAIRRTNATAPRSTGRPDISVLLVKVSGGTTRASHLAASAGGIRLAISSSSLCAAAGVTPGRSLPITW